MISKQIGEIVLQARRQAGLTQRQLATKAHTTQSVVSHLEAGKGGRLRTIEHILAALDTAIDIKQVPPIDRGVGVEDERRP